MRIEPLKILMAQINPTVGDIVGNATLILDIIREHDATHDVLLFPELALTGYSPDDLLFEDALFTQIDQALAAIQQAVTHAYVIIGHPQRARGCCYNAASIFYQRQRFAHYHKQCLPNTGIFDEQRYFTEGEAHACVLTVRGVRLGVCICEDLWHPKPIKQLVQAGAQGVLSLNASPFELGKQQQRLAALREVTKHGLFVVYVNLVGGQDAFLFDGQSLVLDAQGGVCVELPAFETATYSVALPFRAEQVKPTLSPIALLYKGLVMAVRDYLDKNHFSGVLVGLSGGIDSALTLAIAVDALGPDRVIAVKMPSRYTQAMSIEDADLEIQALQVACHTLAIEPAFQALQQTLAPVFLNDPPGLPEENLQARVRGVLLMALSNQTGHLVLTTSNKSELAMGYGTLYGDMAGAFAVLKDVYKTQVYALARYRNTQSPVIPERVLSRAPSAELADDQTDQDTLPPYERLDPLLEALVVHHATVEQLLKQGFSSAEIDFVRQGLRRNEYKRTQAPLGPHVTTRGFGPEWRLPVTNGMR